MSLPHIQQQPWHLLSGLLVLAACSADGPTRPEVAAPPALGRATFHLTIDVSTGRVTVARPSAALGRASENGPSFSLIGDDALVLHTSNCSWSDVGKKKRCTFDLALENRLAQTDLVTPTTFPSVPVGVNGIMVFPFSSAALGVTGGIATPSPDWDNAPANFFNDFAGCTVKSSDCYRYEVFPGPLYGGESTAPRTVGFDVDRSAHTVSAYIVVAADLRENPVQEMTLGPDVALCGLSELNRLLGTATGVGDAPLFVGNRDGDVVNGRVTRGFCSFSLSQLRVIQATLRVFQYDAGPHSYAFGDPVLVDRVDLGAALDGSDFDAAALEPNIGTISSDATLGWKTLDVTSSLQNAAANNDAKWQFRLRYRDDMTVPSDQARFEGPSDGFGTPSANPPELVLRYTIQ